MLFELKSNPPNYPETHKACVMVLNMLGMKINPKYRLDPFRLTIKLDKEYADRPETAEARRLLARLVLLRSRRLEPPHRNGTYLPRSLDELT